MADDDDDGAASGRKKTTASAGRRRMLHDSPGTAVATAMRRYRKDGAAADAGPRRPSSEGGGGSEGGKDATLTGRRTGLRFRKVGTVATSPQSGFEDMNKFWEEAVADDGDDGDDDGSMASRRAQRRRDRAGRAAERQSRKEAAAATRRERAEGKVREAKSRRPGYDLAPTPESENSDPQKDATATTTTTATNASSASAVGGRWAERLARNTAAASSASASAGSATASKLTFSPSELSRVSTAPPTPFESAKKEEQKEEDEDMEEEEEESKVESKERPDEEEENDEGKDEEDEATPERVRGANDGDALHPGGSGASAISPASGEVLDGILRQRQSRTPEAPVGDLDLEGDDDLFPAADDDGIGGGMDLDDGFGGSPDGGGEGGVEGEGEGEGEGLVSPPPPPAEESMDELVANTSLEEDRLDAEEADAAAEEAVDGDDARDDARDGDGDDDYDDDDKESGVGFQMADEAGPETPDQQEGASVGSGVVSSSSGRKERTPTRGEQLRRREEEEEEEEEKDEDEDEVVGKSSSRSRLKDNSDVEDNIEADDAGADGSMEVTPEDGRKKMKKKTSKAKKKKKGKSKEGEGEEDSDDDEEDGGGKKKKKKTKKKRKRVTYATATNFSTPEGKSHGYPAGNRSYQPVPVSDFKNDDDDETNDGRRRSKRARFPPLAFWKNERIIYEAHNEEGALGEAMGDMPVVGCVLTALDTPYKARKAPAQGAKKRGGGKGKGGAGKKSRPGDDSDDDDGEGGRAPPPFDTRRLRKKYDYIDGENALTWNEADEEADETKIVSYSEGRMLSELPLTAARTKKESKVVARAAQAFHIDANANFPGWISGQLQLPPTGIKDAEGVGLCSQVFNVANCQPKALEFAIGDPEESDGLFRPETAQRFLLSPGDMFYVPAGNVYRIENHSKTHDCQLFWTIVRPCKNGSS